MPETATASDSPAERIERAIEWVVLRMRGLRRKGGERPMIVHSLRVGFALDRAGEEPDVITAGFLHDLIEDASVTAAEIQAAFGDAVAALVLACTHDVALHDRDREAANEDLFRRAAAAGRGAIAIKVADAADNMLSVHNLAPDRQQQFLKRAERWAKLGEHFLGPTHGLTTQLHRRLERAKATVAV